MDGYEFDEPVERRGTDSLKWDVDADELPCWVADMDFRCADEIREALARRVEHGVFGYSIVPDRWYEAYRRWWHDRHGWDIEHDWLVFCTGVVPAISSMVRKLTTPGEKVLIQTPVYNVFFNSIVNNGRFVEESPLVYRDGVYSIDFEDLENRLSDPQVTLMILCNPHNPVGKIWRAEELERIGELARRHRVIVISDEIHGDLTAPGVGYTPFASVSSTCAAVSVSCLAPTKAFNLAGLQTAAVVAPDPSLRHRVWRGLNTDEVAEPNALACIAAEAAFEEGAPWLDALRSYLFANRGFAEEYLVRETPELRPVAAEATYLMWIDCNDLCDDAEPFARFVRERTGLVLNDGESYGDAGRGFVRLNMACPRTTLEDALARLREGVRAWQEVHSR